MSSTVALVVFALLVLWRAEPLVKQLLAQRERALALREREVTPPAPAAPLPPMPSTLLLGAMGWDDEWARDSAVARVQEIWRESGGDVERANERVMIEQLGRGTADLRGGSR